MGVTCSEVLVQLPQKGLNCLKSLPDHHYRLHLPLRWATFSSWTGQHCNHREERKEPCNHRGRQQEMVQRSSV